MMIAGSCHCGQVRFEVEKPQAVTSCNCSICRRLGWILAYYEADQVRMGAGQGRTAGYIQGDRTLASHHCPTCGVATHWVGRGEHAHRIGVNIRLFDPKDLDGVTVRFLDGADTWQVTGEAPFGN
ncbi:MAG TPA: GFA family protein [Caulobacteraceae bacterium]|nr:GFA family protein [Caulobacteraceae bacterium]